MKAAKTLTVIGALMRQRISRAMFEAPSFWTAFLVDGVLFVVQAFVFWAIYIRVDAINGWDRSRAIFFVGAFTLLDGILMCLFFFGVIRIPEIIRTGKLDAYLARPVDSLLYISFEALDPGSALLALPAIGLLAYAASISGQPIGPAGIAGFLGAMAMMLVLMHSLMVLIRVPAFWLKRTDAFQATENSLMELGFRIPGSAYRGVFKVLFRVVLPYGLLASLPTEAFFGEASWKTWAAAALVTAAFAVLARVLWRLGLKRYGSSGS